MAASAEGYRFVTLPNGQKMAFGPEWSDAQIRDVYGVDPSTGSLIFPPDFSTHIWSILIGACAVFVMIDFLANRLRPLPRTRRWQPTVLVAGVAGGGYAALTHVYQWPQAQLADRQMLIDHPWASGVGAVTPTLLAFLLLWFFTRLRAKRMITEALPTPPMPGELHGTMSTDPFEIAGGEVLSGNVKAGLWARALIEGGDQDGLVKAAYIQARVDELQRKTSETHFQGETAADASPSMEVDIDVQALITFNPKSRLFCVTGDDGVTIYGYDKKEDAEASVRMIIASRTPAESLAAALRERNFRVQKSGVLWKIREPNGLKLIFVNEEEFVGYAEKRLQKENYKDAV